MKRRIRVLNPTSAWGGGHIQTCINIVRGMQRAGADVHLHLLRSRVDMTDVPHSSTVPSILARFSLSRLERARRERTERRYLSQLNKGDIALLWPTVSIGTYREISRRGNPIVMEGINTRMASARRILDAVYAREGLPPVHKITDTRVEEEEEMLSLATHFFAPNPGVEAALAEKGSRFRGHVLPTSYGTWVPTEPPQRRAKTADDMVTVLFVGTVDIRKNGHGLLRAWSKLAPTAARLVLCGAVAPDVSRLCASELAMPSVDARGHVGDMASVYRDADIFVMPSFEEGGPQVTYEAAGYGLPIIASPMGEGRMGQRSAAVAGIDPNDVPGMAATLGRFIADAELRNTYGQRAREAAPQFDWNRVGQERYDLLRESLGP